MLVIGLNLDQVLEVDYRPNRAPGRNSSLTEVRDKDQLSDMKLRTILGPLIQSKVIRWGQFRTVFINPYFKSKFSLNTKLWARSWMLTWSKELHSVTQFLCLGPGTALSNHKNSNKLPCIPAFSKQKGSHSPLTILMVVAKDAFVEASQRWILFYHQKNPLLLIQNNRI